MTRLVIRFHPDLNVTYKDGLFYSHSVETIELINSILENYPDAQIEPLFSGTKDEVPTHMRGYYTIHLVDIDRAQALQKQLQGSTSVEAAYIKPPDGLP